MAGAQLENGYTRVANELLEALAWMDLTGLELRLVVTVMRLTYGYNRREAPIGLGRYRRFCRADDRAIQRALKHLVELNVLRRQARRGDGDGHRASVWGLNKDPSTWSTPVAVTPPRDRPSRYGSNRPESAETGSNRLDPAGADGADGADATEQGSSAGRGEVPAGRDSCQPGSPAVPVDELTRQLLEEGYTGLRLAQEHRKRSKGRPGLQAGSPPGLGAAPVEEGAAPAPATTTPGQDDAPSEQRDGEQAAPSDDTPGPDDAPSPRARVRENGAVQMSPPRGGQDDAPIKDRRKETPLPPNARAGAPEAGNDPRVHPDPGKTRPAHAEKPPERQPAANARGPTHVAQLAARFIPDGDPEP